MPLIQFDTKKEEGFYLLASNGEIGCYANRVYWATDLLLRQLEPLFQEKGVRYHRLTQDERPVTQTSRQPQRPKKTLTVFRSAEVEPARETLH